MTPRNATEFVQLVERRLGWVAPTHLPPWQHYRAEAAKVNRQVATNPRLYTWKNLELAVELLAREKEARTPIGVFAHVQRALDLALDEDPDLDQLIAEAVAYEQQRGDPAGWAVRFARATGGYRRLALDEWFESVR